LNHLVLEHLSGVKGGCPLEEAYYLKLSLFQGVEYFSEVFLCYIDIWFLTLTLENRLMVHPEIREDQLFHILDKESKEIRGIRQIRETKEI
jgi:hypothetical protein